MLMQETTTITTKQLGHLGLISSVIKKLNLVDKIDRRLPVSKEHGSIVSMGQRVSAMILNGLGFLNDRLYMHSVFFEDKAVEFLLGEGITANHINDDALGRALDAIHSYGTTKLFSEIAFEVAHENKLLGKTARLDTTSISLYGEYDGCDREEEAIDITYGFAKNKRYDLKQIILSLTNSGKSGHPLWMEVLSGNSSDKKNFQETVRKIDAFKKQLQDGQDFIYVADSALYTIKKLLAAKHLRWITRVPESIKAARELVEKDSEEFTWKSLGDKYNYCELKSEHGGVEQRWQVIYSTEAFKKEEKSLTKRIEKEKSKINKVLWHMSNKKYTAKEEIKVLIKPILKKLKYHTLGYVIQKGKKYKTKGRPKPDAQDGTVVYRLECSLTENAHLIQKANNRLGRFILATNELDNVILPSSEILKEYKDLDKVEKGFRFVKSSEFALSSVFLKTPSRIEALMMVMTLCLMVYNFGEKAFRRSLDASNETIPNQLGKETKTPTMRWVFRILNKITVAYIRIDGIVKSVVANVCGVCNKIIKHFGGHAMHIYGVT